MGLVACQDCGRKISDAAPSCPGCGRPAQASFQAPPVAPIASPPIAYPQPGRPAPSPPSKSERTLRWVMGTLVFLFVAALAVVVIKKNTAGSTGGSSDVPSRPHESSLLGKARVECKAAGWDALSCAVKSEGAGAVKVCWDVVVSCRATDHRGHECSRLVPADSTESYTLREFSPPFQPAETCGSMRVENMVIQ